MFFLPKLDILDDSKSISSRQIGKLSRSYSVNTPCIYDENKANVSKQKIPQYSINYPDGPCELLCQCLIINSKTLTLSLIDELHK